jgi:hypothetical protein
MRISGCVERFVNQSVDCYTFRRSFNEYISGILDGLQYSSYVDGFDEYAHKCFTNLTIDSGETKDLGNIVITIKKK